MSTEIQFSGDNQADTVELPQAPVMTEPGCQHPLCVLEHPHAGPAELPAVSTAAGPAELDPAPDGPVPMLAGTFAIYQDGSGGFVLVTDTTAGGVERRHIPAAMVKLVTGGGLISRKFASIFGGQ